MSLAAVLAASYGTLTTNPVPAGTVAYFGASSAPSGWLSCDGSAVSRTTYAALFSIIGTTYGTGNGSTTFNLPDLRGEFIRGLDGGRGVDTGRTLGSSQSDQNKAHTHTITDPGHTHSTSAKTNAGGSTYGSGTAGSLTAAANGSSTTGITINSDGGTEARPRNVALLPCIKT